MSKSFGDMPEAPFRIILPLPEINESANLSHSFKQSNRNNSYRHTKRPPKLHPKHELNLSRGLNSTSHLAQAITFKTPTKKSDLSLSVNYKVDKKDSYFDQCFEELSKIGEGSFGEVFKVISKDDGLYYAIKKSKQIFKSTTYRLERLEEVRRHEQFSEHEHCVTLYKAWEQDDHLYMQMELCQGNLENLVFEQKHIPEDKVWNYLLDLLLAVKGLHDKNLIHLDIKLENILISDDEKCKLADFGLVIDLNRENLHQATEGDSRYIAPELMQGNFSKSADIFSLGIAILELSCNLDLPSNGPLWQELRSGVFQDDVICLLSTDLQQMIKWMMSPNPLERPNVDSLLRYPKLESMKQHRHRWRHVKKFTTNSKKFGKNILRILRNLKKKFINFFSSIICLKHVKKGSESLLELDDSVIQHSTPDVVQKGGLLKTPCLVQITNSTPLNHHSGSFRKFRKDLSKTSLGFNSFDDEYCDVEPNKNSFLQHSSSNSSCTENSSIICKKLFFREDSD